MKKLSILLSVIFLIFSDMNAQKNQALLVIDIQNDYFKGGAMELVGSDLASAKARMIIEKFREQKCPVIYIQHISDYEGATFFLPNTDGNKIHTSVAPVSGEKIIVKHFPNSFINTDLQTYLQENKIENLVIVGMMTHMCVDATIRAAKDLGYACTLIGDACATRNLKIGDRTVMAQDVQTAFLAALNGAYARVVKAEDFVK